MPWHCLGIALALPLSFPGLPSKVRKEKHRLADHSLAEHMENERLEQQELEHKLDIEKRKQRERVKVINQQQIAMKEAQREEAMKEYVKDRKQVEALEAKNAEEDAKEAKARSDKQAEPLGSKTFLYNVLRRSRLMLQKFMLEQPFACMSCCLKGCLEGVLHWMEPASSESEESQPREDRSGRA